MIKRCSKCREEKNTGEFRKDNSKPDGLQPWCKPCARLYHKSAYTLKYGERARVRQAIKYEEVYSWIKAYKEHHRCRICSEGFAGCLEFHHTDPTTKEFTVTASLNRSLESIVAEIEKCVVVCSNCHKKMHAGVLTLESGQDGNAAPC